EVGVLAIVVRRMHDPGRPEFIDRGGTEDVSLRGADREAVIAVVGTVSVVRRGAARGEDPGTAARPMKDTVDRVFRRDLPIYAEIDPIDARIVGDRRNVVRRAVGKSGEVQIGWRRKERQ